MAIAVDNSGVGQRVTGQTNTLVDFVVGSGDDRILLVMTCFRHDGVEKVDTVVFNGSESFTEITGLADSTVYVQMWYLLNPTNTTADIVATGTVDPSSAQQVAAASYTGVKQVAPTNYSTGTNSDWVDYGIDLVTSYANSMVWGGIGSYAPNLDPITADYTEVYNDDASCGLFVESLISTTTGTYTLTWTSSGATNAALIHLEVREVDVSREQEGFRWRNDDGTDETDATWRQNQDVDDTVNAETTIRLRMLVNATGDPLTAQYKLQYKRTSEPNSAYRDVKVP